MSTQPGFVIIAVIAIVNLSGCGNWPNWIGQPEPREDRVKLLTSGVAERPMPVLVSPCVGPDSESAVVSVDASGPRTTGVETRM